MRGRYQGGGRDCNHALWRRSPFEYPRGMSDRTEPASGAWRQFATFAWQHKFVWIIPLVIVLLLIALLLFANYSSAPFHYTVM
jgi:hypothetical protein